MKAKIILFSNTSSEINYFLNMFYSTNLEHCSSTIWKKDFQNPIEIAEYISAFVDNINIFNLSMWISLDKDIFIKVSPVNSNNIIKYLFERYPY